MLAYLLTEEVPPREIDGPSANLALGDIISNVLPLDGKKDKLLGSDSNNVSITSLDRLNWKTNWKWNLFSFGIRSWMEVVKAVNQRVRQV